MARFTKPSSRKAGLPPGTLVYTGHRGAENVRITIIDYDENHFEELEAGTCEDCFRFRDTSTVTWINVDGVHELGIVEKIGHHFDLHPLIIEDIVHTEQRPKVEEFEDYIYVVLRMLRCPEGKDESEAEQVSVVFGRNFVISFQEREGDLFDQIRDRIRTSKGRIRKMRADYLAYCLLDAVVDGYFTVLEKLGERVELLEDELVSKPTSLTLQAIHEMKRGMIFLRKSVWPLREVISNLQRAESPLIAEATAVYLRDVYDHTIQVIDTIETFRDIIAGMLDTYLSSISNRMNEVMKVLTIIATIFIPLTFIAGIYGMNFKYMPELEWHYGYFAAIAAMVLVAAGMVIYFFRKKWL